jgi:5-methylcytosine-specific restriction endonuclease McrA
MALEIRHTLFGVEIINPAPVCRMMECGEPADNSGYGRYHKYCSKHHRGMYQNKNGGQKYKQYRKDYCENIDGRLGFVCTATIIDVRWQLETDHRDGDKSNDAEENLQTFCANCHRIKTKIKKENLSPEKRPDYLLKELNALYN